MKLDLETGTVLAVLRGGHEALVEALSLGFKVELFTGAGMPVFQYVVKHYREHGEVPPESVIASRFPDFELPPVKPAGLRYYLAELRKRALHNQLSESMKEAAKLLKGKEPEAALEVLAKAIRDAQAEEGGDADVNLRLTAEERWERYLFRKEHKGLLGYPTPWPALDRMTLGWQKKQLITVAARQGVGKSWMLVLVAAKLQEMGLVPLIVTREMAVREIDVRFDAVKAKVPHAGLRVGDLTPDQEERYRVALSNIGEEEDFWVTDDTSSGTLTGLRAKVEKRKPDMLLVDGAYLMQDEQGNQGWEATTELTRGLKRLAKEMDIPVLISHQINRDGAGKQATTANLAYSDSVGQDSDVVIIMYQDEDMRLSLLMLIKLVKQRDGQHGELTSNWDLGAMDFGEAEAEEDDWKDDGKTDDEWDDDNPLF